MEFKIIEEKKYQYFWDKHPLKSFLSSIEIGHLRKDSGWDVVYTGVFENKKLIGAAMLVSKLRKLGKKEFYSPRGLLIDFSNDKLLSFYIKELKKYVKENNGYVLRIDPYIIYKQRDIDGNIVENGIDNSQIVNNLINLGFKKVDSKDREQVGWMFSLDLEGKDEDEILKQMRQNTRNIIRKTEKIGIDVKKISYDELDIFHNILVETGKRKDFKTRDISYYQQMYKLFSKKDEVRFYITQLDLDKYIKCQKQEIKEKQEKIEKISKEGQKRSLNEDIESLNKKIIDAEEIIEKTGKHTINLSGSMFILIKPEIVYLSSGNYEEYLKYNSQYLIQWELIKYGIKHGFKKHNFYGIPDNINTHPKDYGIYEFKKGFNGYVEELIGEFELPTSIEYYILKIIHKLRKK